MSTTIVPTDRKAKVRRLAERGLTTVEYAIGLLAAATIALLLVRVFADNAFFEMLFNWVTDVFGQVLTGGFRLSDILPGR